MISAILLTCHMALMRPTAEPISERYALIIGIDKYPSARAGITELEFASNDAIAMYQTLAKHGGFKPENMILLTSNSLDENSKPYYSNIVTARLNLMQKIGKPDDLLFIYVAGHGFTLDGAAVFPAMDARWGTEVQIHDIPLSPATHGYMDASYFLALDSLKARNLIAVFDMCRNEPIASKVTSPNSRSLLDGTLANALRQTRVTQRDYSGTAGGPPPVFREMKEAIFMACEIGQTSQELPSLRRGAFSYCFGEAFSKGDANGDNVVSLSEVISYVEKEVPKLTENKQLPTSYLKGSSVAAISVSLAPKAQSPDLPLPKFEPKPDMKIESEKNASGKVRQTVSSFTGVYSIVPTNTGYELTSGEGGFNARIPISLQKDPVRREPESITTPDGQATLIGYSGEDRTGYDFSAFGAYYLDYPSSSAKSEKDLLKWAEQWLRDKSNSSIFQKELSGMVQESMNISDDIWKVSSKDVLDAVFGGIFGSKRPKAVMKAENYDIAGSPGRRITWIRVPTKEEQGSSKAEPGSRGYVTVQIAIVGKRIFFLKEGFALDKEPENDSKYSLLKRFIRSFDFVD